MPANPDTLKAICYADDGSVKPRTECRSSIIHHLVSDEMMDVDEAEELTEHTMDSLNLWTA